MHTQKQHIEVASTHLLPAAGLFRGRQYAGAAGALVVSADSRGCLGLAGRALALASRLLLEEGSSEDNECEGCGDKVEV